MRSKLVSADKLSYLVFLVIKVIEVDDIKLFSGQNIERFHFDAKFSDLHMIKTISSFQASLGKM